MERKEGESGSCSIQPFYVKDEFNMSDYSDKVLLTKNNDHSTNYKIVRNPAYIKTESVIDETSALFSCNRDIRIDSINSANFCVKFETDKSVKKSPRQTVDNSLYDDMDIMNDSLLSRPNNSQTEKSIFKKFFLNSTELEFNDTKQQNDYNDNIKSNVSSDEDDFVLEMSEDSHDDSIPVEKDYHSTSDKEILSKNKINLRSRNRSKSDVTKSELNTSTNNNLSPAVKKAAGKRNFKSPLKQSILLDFLTPANNNTIDLKKFAVLNCLECNNTSKFLDSKIDSCQKCSVKMVLRCLVCSKYYDTFLEMYNHVLQNHQKQFQNVFETLPDADIKNKPASKENDVVIPTTSFYLKYKKCDKCNKAFPTQSTLANHMKFCKKKLSASCHLCPFKTKNQYHMSAHMNKHKTLEHKDNKIIQNTIKSKNGNLFNNVAKSAISMSDKLKELNDLVKEIENILSPNSKDCLNCRAHFNNRGSLGNHIKFCKEKRILLCNLCPFQANDHYSLKMHMIKEHVQHRDSTTHSAINNKIANEDILNTKQSNNESSLDVTSTMDTSDKKINKSPKRCPICRKGFRKQSSVVNHVKFCMKKSPSNDHYSSKLDISNEQLFHDVSTLNGTINNTVVNKFADLSNSYQDTSASILDMSTTMGTSDKKNKKPDKKCPKCGKEFYHFQNRKKHMRNCKNNPFIQCEMCHFKSKYDSDMKQHVYQVHNSQKISEVDTKNDKKHNSFSRLTRNSLKGTSDANETKVKLETNNGTETTTENKKSGLKEFRCSKCSKKFLTHKSAVGHMTYCGKEPNIRCKYCPYITKFRCNLVKHQHKFHPLESTKKMNIENAEKKISNKSSSSKDAHNSESNSDNLKIISTINKIKTTVPTTASALLTSTVNKSDVYNMALIQCVRCNDTKYGVKIGGNNCTKCKNPLHFKCKNCNKQYVKYANLLHHLRGKCAPTTTFSCPECSHTSTTKDLLKVHMRVHDIKKRLNEKHGPKPTKPILSTILNGAVSGKKSKETDKHPRENQNLNRWLNINNPNSNNKSDKSTKSGNSSKYSNSSEKTELHTKAGQMKERLRRDTRTYVANSRQNLKGYLENRTPKINKNKGEGDAGTLTEADCPKCNKPQLVFKPVAKCLQCGSRLKFRNDERPTRELTQRATDQVESPTSYRRSTRLSTLKLQQDASVAERSFPCNFCPFETKSQKELVHHMVLRHYEQ